MVIREVCPRCKSSQYKKNGHMYNGKQNLHCHDCCASSSSAASNILSRMKSVVLSNAYLPNEFHCGAFVVR
jgi:transposase-like protein